MCLEELFLREIYISKERGTMLERLMQAAFITFLLHLIAGLSAGNQIPTKAVTPMSEISAPVLSSTLHFLK